MRSYYVYIMSNAARTLYVGVTNDLERRVDQYKQGTTPGFTSRYKVTYLVYYEETADVHEAIGREKQAKGWTRERKMALVEADNHGWRDLIPSPAGRAAYPWMAESRVSPNPSWSWVSHALAVHQIRCR